jgi:hypothetical protein
VDLHDLVPHLVGHQAEAGVRAMEQPDWAAAALIHRERGIRRGDPRRDELTPQLLAEASARVILWNEAGRRAMPSEAYREARQRLHGRDLLDFRPAASGEPVVILDGVERSLREAVAEALDPSPRKIQIAVPAMPSGYRQIKRIAGFEFGEDRAAVARKRLLEPPKDDDQPDVGGGSPAPPPAPRIQPATPAQPRRKTP